LGIVSIVLCDDILALPPFFFFFFLAGRADTNPLSLNSGGARPLLKNENTFDRRISFFQDATRPKRASRTVARGATSPAFRFSRSPRCSFFFFFVRGKEAACTTT
jgi:hypothetical protein